MALCMSSLCFASGDLLDLLNLLPLAQMDMARV